MTTTARICIRTLVAIQPEHCPVEAIGGRILPIPHQHVVLEVPALDGEAISDQDFVDPVMLIRTDGEIILN